MVAFMNFLLSMCEKVWHRKPTRYQKMATAVTPAAAEPHCSDLNTTQKSQDTCE